MSNQPLPELNRIKGKVKLPSIDRNGIKVPYKDNHFFRVNLSYARFEGDVQNARFYVRAKHPMTAGNICYRHFRGWHIQDKYVEFPKLLELADATCIDGGDYEAAWYDINYRVQKKKEPIHIFYHGKDFMPFIFSYYQKRLTPTQDAIIAP